jgi:GAF domain-containing protein
LGWILFCKSRYQNIALRTALCGAETDHTVIPFGKEFADKWRFLMKTFGSDVAAQDYIACSFTVKSEIVVPLFVDGKNIGQIDNHVLIPLLLKTNDFEFVCYQNYY